MSVCVWLSDKYSPCWVAVKLSHSSSDLVSTRLPTPGPTFVTHLPFSAHTDRERQHNDPWRWGVLISIEIYTESFAYFYVCFWTSFTKQVYNMCANGRNSDMSRKHQQWTSWKQSRVQFVRQMKCKTSRPERLIDARPCRKWHVCLVL